jgi:hypothetical protein
LVTAQNFSSAKGGHFEKPLKFYLFISLVGEEGRNKWLVTKWLCPLNDILIY